MPIEASRGTTHLERIHPRRDSVRPHLRVVDPETSPFVMRTDVSCARTLVETLVYVLGCKPQLAVFATERLGWLEHDRGKVRGCGRTWPNLAGSGEEGAGTFEDRSRAICTIGGSKHRLSFEVVEFWICSPSMLCLILLKLSATEVED